MGKEERQVAGKSWMNIEHVAAAQGIIYDKGPQLLPLVYSRPCLDAILFLDKTPEIPILS